jgi:hypothetical protein
MRTVPAVSRMQSLILAVLFAGIVLPTAVNGKPAGDSEFPFDSAVTVLSQTLAHADRIEIFEGLAKDPAVAARQKQANSCRQIADQWFYTGPDELRMRHVMKLQRLVDGGAFERHREGKMCGFHADYALAAAFSKFTIYVLFCFGCHEGKLIREANPFAADLRTPDFQLTMDISDKSFEEVRSLLTGYHNPGRGGGPAGGG